MAWTGVACSPLWLYGKGKGFVAVVRFQSYHVIYHVMTLMYSFNTHLRFSISTSKFAWVGDSRCLGAVQRPQGEKKQSNENDA